MSKKPTTPTTPKPPPTAYELEQSVSLWMQLQHAFVTEDPEFAPDEGAIDAAIAAAGHEPPRAMLSRLIDVSVMLDHKAEHMDMLRKRFSEKRDRYNARKDRVRTTITQLMEVLGETAVEADLATASFGKPRAKVEADVTKLPEQYIRRTDPEPKLFDLAAALRRGETIEGAQWSDMTNAAPVLRVVKY